jgi:hypothetical protein
MAQQDKDDLYNENPKDTTYTGSDLPHGDGTTSDEDTHKITDGQKLPDKPIGQDHSTEGRENQMPTSGVGAFEDSSQQITSSTAHITDDEGEE